MSLIGFQFIFMTSETSDYSSSLFHLDTASSHSPSSWVCVRVLVGVGSGSEAAERVERSRAERM